MKTVLGGFLSAREIDPHDVQKPRLNLDNVRANAYHGASLKYLKFSKNSGLEAQISFSQPHHLQKKSKSEQRRWWEAAKRLDEGSMTCLFAPEGQPKTLIFLTVSGKSTDPRDPMVLSQEVTAQQ